MKMRRNWLLCVLSALAINHGAVADEAAIRRNIKERFPDLPAIDEVTRTPVNGLWEVRMGAELVYSDAQGSYLVDGHIIDTRSRTNLTEARISKLTAIDFAKLPLKDAIVWKQGTGARKMVVFADPNCGYCKRLESDLNGVKNITVYTFLYPILGGDSADKSRAIWCSKDNAKVWRSWMLDNKQPAQVMGKCDSSAIDRNVALGRKHGVNGTPSMVFASGERVPGIVSLEELEKKFAAVPGLAAR